MKILNGQTQAGHIDDSTWLIRYMKLSTFLLLLDNGLFIPSIRRLQDGDSFEARIPEKRLSPNYWQKMRAVVEPHEDLLLKTAVGSKVLREEGAEHNDAALAFLIERWLHQLAIRRCVWCWDASTDQLYAMWKLYGERGVAIFSTVGSIREALEKAGVREGIVSPVRYAGDKFSSRPEEVATRLAMEQPENLLRPYLFKDAGYRIEEEVRFVLHTNPLVTSALGGILIKVDAKALIKGFRVSPDLPAAERRYIARFAWERLNFKTPPPSHWTEESESFFLQPFSKDADNFQDVFTDLR